MGCLSCCGPSAAPGRPREKEFWVVWAESEAVLAERSRSPVVLGGGTGGNPTFTCLLAACAQGKCLGTFSCVRVTVSPPSPACESLELSSAGSRPEGEAGTGAQRGRCHQARLEECARLAPCCAQAGAGRWAGGAFSAPLPGPCRRTREPWGSFSWDGTDKLSEEFSTGCNSVRAGRWENGMKLRPACSLSRGSAHLGELRAGGGSLKR